MPDALLLHCQHGLGMGHLVRSLAIAEALAERFRVVLLCGGRIPEQLRLPDSIETVALPALRLGPAGELLSDAEGHELPERVLARRRERLLAVLNERRPRAVVVELFPFGRKKLAPELIPFLQAARAPHVAAFVACSLRDLLVSTRHDQQVHDDRAAGQANELVDAVLVHADPRFARLEETFRPSTPLRVPVHYTGFVTRNRPASAEPRRRILVSAGGGRVGGALLSTAIRAQERLWPECGIPMRLVAGPFLPETELEALRREIGGRAGLELVASVPDLAGEIAGARVSVSQCGYNTALEVVQARTPALFVPYATPLEDEQRRRARRLAELGVARVLEPEALAPDALADAIRALLDERPAPTTFALDGARTTADLLATLVAAQATPARRGLRA